MRRNKVKLISLRVTGLYGCYDYEVPFNEDITLLFGANGCGKTTILNITEYIVTGQLYRLFTYKYKSIVLNYVQNNKYHNVKTISIVSTKNGLRVTVDEFEKAIDIKKLDDDYFRSDIAGYYFNRYDILKKIRQTFNYVYLPLSRVERSIQNNKYDFESFDRYIEFSSYKFNYENNYKEDPLTMVAELIRTKYTEISSKLDELNKKFQNDIIRSLLDIRTSYHYTDIVEEFSNSTTCPLTLDELKQEYLNFLKGFDESSKNDEKKYTDFFDSILKFGRSSKQDLQDNDSFEMLFKIQEMIKMQKALQIKKNMDQQREAIRMPLDLFLKTVNDFINDPEEEKQIEINAGGEIYLSTKQDNHISIQFISSGERQLVIFFANLIFNIERESSGIFMVDEPELSLHLYWQKIFIDKIREVNPNIQIIFATHAPEIIGKHRDKMFKLTKIYSKAEK